jgi:hypothetical protein
VPCEAIEIDTFRASFSRWDMDFYS